MLLQASVFEWKIIHLEGQRLGQEGRPTLRLGDKSHAEMFAGKVQFVRRGEAGHAGSLLSVSICHSHPLAASLELLSPGKLHTSVLKSR